MSDVFISEEQLDNKNKKSKKDNEKRQFEIELAKSIYDNPEVRQAGQEALSRISTLLIRYNRLMDLKNQREIDIRELEAEYAKKGNSTTEKEEADGDKENKKPAEDPALTAEKEKRTQAFMQAVEETVDTDNAGGILSTLMLGGNALGSKGYTLTSGDEVDLKKGGDYIKDVSGEKGTLFEQMSLIDNAVNTSGIDLQAGEAKTDQQQFMGSSLTGAKYSLNDILNTANKDDLALMNLSRSEEKVQLDVDSIKEDLVLDDYIGKGKAQQTLQDAFDARGGISKEAAKRKAGEIGGVNDYTDNEKKLLKAGFGNSSMTNSFWGSLGFVKRRRMKSVNNLIAEVEKERNPEVQKDPQTEEEKKNLELARKLQAQSPQTLRQRRLAWKAEMEQIRKIRRDRAKNPRQVELNANDNANDNVPKLNDKELDAAKNLSEKGDKSVRNMIAAYRYMGATPEELYHFRLAIIAYMVPTGKKTIREILNESAEGGFVGNENLSSDEQMYASLLEEPIVEGVYVNKFKKKSLKERQAKFLKEIKEKKKEKAPKPKPKAVLTTISEADEELENIDDEQDVLEVNEQEHEEEPGEVNPAEKQQEEKNPEDNEEKEEAEEAVEEEKNKDIEEAEELEEAANNKPLEAVPIIEAAEEKEEEKNPEDVEDDKAPIEAKKEEAEPDKLEDTDLSVVIVRAYLRENIKGITDSPQEVYKKIRYMTLYPKKYSKELKLTEQQMLDFTNNIRTSKEFNIQMMKIIKLVQKEMMA